MNDCSEFNRPVPYIIINCAMSIDGKIALPTKKPIKLSSLEDFKRVHELRNYCDGILVGVNTIVIDDPKLTVKPEFVIKAKNPTRIVLDTHGRTPKSAKVFNGDSKTIIVVDKKLKNKNIEFKNADVLYCSTNSDGLIWLEELMRLLKDEGIENLLVEGGETVIFNFLKNKMADELNIYMSNVIIGGTMTPTLAGGSGIVHEDEVINLKLFSHTQMGDGILLKYTKK